ncbi:MAG: hypothetical protein ABSF95_04175 [Verrucomicrobiota bacterium]|jgi:hypothetical protein
MPIEFPDLANTHLAWITACGKVLLADRELVKWMKGEKDKIAPLTTSRGVACVRLMLGGRSGNHVHFDVLSPEMVSEKLKGESKSTLDDIQKSVSPLVGREVDVNLRGGFETKLQELPDSGIVRSLRFQTKIGNVAIKLDGAMLSIEGAPVQNISWHAGRKDNIRITVEAESLKTTLSENYLISLVDTLQQAFAVFVLGKA